MKFTIRSFGFTLFLLCCFFSTRGQDFVSFSGGKNFLNISTAGQEIYVLVSPDEHAGVRKVVNMLARDIEAVTLNEVKVISEVKENIRNLIIVGSADKSSLLQQMADTKTFDTKDLEGKWEKFIIEAVADPMPGIRQGLVISGSDKRGTIFGMFELSRQIGVSPWYWWADAPIEKNTEIFIKPGRHTKGEPDVKYRGIFINDEAPALTGWVAEKFGGFNADFYEKVFELILRNQGNFLWPAMWRPQAFAADDPENARLADELGIVISTSHHEPLMRAHDEWSRFDGGAWNYQTNKEKLQEFWRGGIKRMGDYESVVTLGMRGDGDEAMSEETAVPLLQEIIADQRTIIEEVTGKPAEETPQVWAIYKEVQDYYDKGMRVPDDITVLFCDDNWGNVRILPKPEDLDREGGFGMYYHFDFVGGPVSYRWLNVTQIERIWEQMNLSYDWGVKELWVVNVGDIKPMELPISFFLDFAWDASTMKAEDIPAYYEQWASLQFGSEYAAEIAEILALYTKYNARRTPEMLKPDTYSLNHYREAERVIDEYHDLLQRSQAIYDKLPESHQSAFYQLVLSPVALCSNLNEMYVAAHKNKVYAMQGRASANLYAEKTKELFFRDEELSDAYHNINDGKWNHLMAQTHIGYTSWNNPPNNKMPDISYIQVEEQAGLAYAVEHGEPSRWTRSNVMSSSFSTFDPINDQQYYLEIFNQGNEELSYTLSTDHDWILLSKCEGSIKHEEKIYVRIDWDKVPDEVEKGQIKIQGAGMDRAYTVQVPVRKVLPQARGFVENNGMVSIEAANYTSKTETKNISWVRVPKLGRNGSSMTVEPANAQRQSIGKKTPMLAYDFTLFDGADLQIHTHLSPTLNYKKNEGLKFAIAIDDEEPQIINMHEGETQPDWEYPEWWNKSVTDHIKVKTSLHHGVSAGQHTLKIWMIDPGVVFQKFVMDAGGLKPSYLGPPESKFVTQ